MSSTDTVAENLFTERKLEVLVSTLQKMGYGRGKGWPDKHPRALLLQALLPQKLLSVRSDLQPSKQHYRQPELRA